MVALRWNREPNQRRANRPRGGKFDENALVPAILFAAGSGTCLPAPRYRLTCHRKMRGSMPTARYFIVHDQVQDEWMIKYGKDEFGPYKTQDEAMLFAIDAAQKLGAYGESAEVCLMGENGHFHTEWTSGRARQSQPAGA